MQMIWAYRAVAHINGQPAGVVGIYLRKTDYERERPANAPSVRFTRIRIDPNVAALMRRGQTFAQACEAIGKGGEAGAIG